MGLGPSCYCQWSKGNKEICYGKGYPANVVDVVNGRQSSIVDDDKISKKGAFLVTDSPGFFHTTKAKHFVEIFNNRDTKKPLTQLFTMNVDIFLVIIIFNGNFFNAPISISVTSVSNEP